MTTNVIIIVRNNQSANQCATLLFNYCNVYWTAS